MELRVTERAMMRPATQEDIDLVEVTLRAGDRAECEIFGPRKMWHQDIDDFEECWAIFGHGKLVGYCGVYIEPGQTALSPARWLCFLSTQAADTMKVSFVRHSRAVLKEIVKRTSEHVETFLSMPMNAYRGSIIWHERVLKMHKSREAMINNHPHTIFYTTRKEVLSWKF
jgi:hypothetical protein